MQPQLSDAWFKERISAVSDFIASILSCLIQILKVGKLSQSQEEIAMGLKSQSAGDQLRNNTLYYIFAPLKFHDFEQVKVNMQTINVANITGHQN